MPVPVSPPCTQMHVRQQPRQKWIGAVGTPGDSPADRAVPLLVIFTHNEMVLWGERVGRRRALMAMLALFALADIAFAVVVMTEGSGGPAQAALPMHPVVGSFVPDDTQVTECSDSRCFQQAFGNIAYREGPKIALSLVDRFYGNGADPACHRSPISSAPLLSRAFRRERRANARGRRPDLLVRLLPRSSRARPPESEVEEAGRARRGGANAVHGSPDDSVDPRMAATTGSAMD